MRVITIVFSLIFAFSGGYLFGTTKVPSNRLEGTQWCFYGEYRSLKAYSSTQGVPHALVDVQRDKVKVYARCSGMDVPHHP